MKRIFKTLLALVLCACVVFSSVAVVGAASSTSYPPYPKVEYSYSSSVAVGTLRYISQLSNSSLFYSSYWGGWASNAGWECGTASISMALSYVGINKTPKNILDAGNGITYFTGWGATRIQPSLSTAMSNYLNGNGKYSPPLIHFAKGSYSSAGHYVLLIGQVSSSSYLVLDPASDSTWTLSTSHSYYSAIDEVHQYYNPDAEIDPPIEGEPVITADKYVYTIGDTITLTRNSVENTNFYWLVLYHYDEQIVSTELEDTEYTFVAEETGTYKAYLQVGNSSGGVTSEPHIFYVQNEITDTPIIQSEKNYYKYGEEVTLTRNEIEDTNFYQLIIYHDEEQIVSTSMTEPEYSFIPENDGEYKIYLQVGNAYTGTITSQPYYFTVQREVTEEPLIWLDRDDPTFEYGEDIVIHRCDVLYATEYRLTITGKWNTTFDFTNETEMTIFEGNDLPSGEYEIRAMALNEVSEPVYSNTLYITVNEQHTCDFEYKVLKEPTCEEDGLSLYLCSCGEGWNEVIPAEGHDIIPATCTQAEHCSKCDEEWGEPLEHDFSFSYVDIEPTCEYVGIRIYVCNCKEYYREEIPALGHSYSATITKAPTCNTYGVKTFTCIHCSDSYAEPIAKTNHVYSDEFTVDTEPTYFSAGMKSRHCLTCTAKTDYTPIDPLVPSATMMVTVRKAMINNSTSKEYDFNGDGAVNILDLIKLKKSYAGVY